MQNKKSSPISALIFLLLLIALGLFGCEQAEVKEQHFETSEAVKTLLDEDLIQARYLGISEESGHTVLHLEFENKTNQMISVLPADTYVDGVVVVFTSESMATIEAGSSFQQAWLIGSRPKDEVEFKIAVYDKELKELFVSDFIKIEMEE